MGRFLSDRFWHQCCASRLSASGIVEALANGSLWVESRHNRALDSCHLYGNYLRAMTYAKDLYRQKAFDAFSLHFSWEPKSLSSYSEHDDVLLAAAKDDRSAMLVYLEDSNENEVQWHADNLREFTGLDGLSVYISGDFDLGLETSLKVIRRWFEGVEPFDYF